MALTRLPDSPAETPTASAPRRSRLERGVVPLLAMGVVLVGLALSLQGPLSLVGRILFDALIATTLCAAAFLGLRVDPRAGRAGWLALSMVLSAYALRFVAAIPAERTTTDVIADPSWADVAFLALSPLLLGGLLVIGFPSGRWSKRLRVVAEALTLSPALVFIGWTLAVWAVPRPGGTSRLELAVLLGLCMVVLTALVVSALSLAELPSFARLLLTLGFAALAVGETTMVLDWATTADVDPRVPLLSWLAGAVLLGLAAHHAVDVRWTPRAMRPLVRSIVIYGPVMVAFGIGLAKLLAGDRLTRVEAGILAVTGVLTGGNHLAVFVENARLTRSLRANLGELAQSERRFRLVLDEMAEGVAVVSEDGTIRTVNGRVGDLLGWQPDELIGGSVFALVHPDDLEPVRASFARALGTGPGEPIVFRTRCADGTYVVIEASAGSHLGEPSIGGLVLSVRDITERRRQEAALREAEERFRVAFESAPIGMGLATVDGELLKANVAFGRMLGAAPEEIEGRNLRELTPYDEWLDDVGGLVPGTTGIHRLRLRYQHSQGSVVLGDTSVSVIVRPDGRRYLICQVEDVTREHAIAERLAYSARHDELTGLLNRSAFMERLASALIRRNPDEIVGLVFLDVDRFKVINDSLGHAAGDRVVRTVANRLRQAAGEEVTLARFGGDEFCAFTTVRGDPSSVDDLADRLARAVSAPVPLSGGTTYVTASLGVAVADRTWVTAESLVRDADAAMYQAKDRGRNRVERFDPAARASVVRLHQTANELHGALERDELRLVFQPIIALGSGELSGFEALVRWQHPQRGAIAPADFIEVAEETGLIVPLGEVVLGKALGHLARWGDRSGSDGLRLSINVSPRQLTEPAFVDSLAAALDRHAVDPSRVWLEITESAVMADIDLAIEVLSRVRSLGVSLAVDDFGTGYSSLTYLQRLPVQGLKVDRSFVAALQDGTEDAAIIQAVTQLAHSLGLVVTAEGVETVTQLTRLRLLGVDLAQGMLVGAPQAADVVDRSLPAWEPLEVLRRPVRTPLPPPLPPPAPVR